MMKITSLLLIALLGLLPVACAGSNDGGSNDGGGNHDSAGEGEGASGGGGEGEGSRGGGGEGEGSRAGGEGEGSNAGGEGEGSGPADDTGKTCSANSDCQNGTCLKGVDDQGNFTDFGYCTKPCQTFADCPTFWDCQAVGDAVGTFCVQN